MPIKGGWIGNNTYIKVLQGRDAGRNGKNGKDRLIGRREEKREQGKRGPPGPPRGGCGIYSLGKRQLAKYHNWCQGTL